ncbi:MAG: ABC transporter substrate-binding protein [Bryobacterales bacterium]|nr:ABC transporter substrate-binding protein [Bryobacterales bacterium]
MRSKLAALLALLASGGCGAGRQESIRLGIAAQQSVSQIPVYLAAQLGLYRKNGLRVELAEFPGASKGMEALLGGSVDVLSGYYTQALAVRAKGRHVDVFLGYYDSLLVALAVAPAAAGRVRRIEDLRGAKVGVTTPGSATHQFVDFLLRRHGLAPSEVKAVAIGTAARGAAAMERGMVDAGVVTDFTIRYLERRFGKLRLLADTRTREGVLEAHGVSAFPGAVLMADSSWIDSHPDEARRLARAVWEAVLWMRAHSVEEIVAKMPASHYGQDREAYYDAVRLAVPMLSNGATISAASHQAAVEFLGASGMETAFRDVGVR